jgi:hypothetical protein
LWLKIHFFLRALRGLRGDICIFFLVAARPRWVLRGEISNPFCLEKPRPYMVRIGEGKEPDVA